MAFSHTLLTALTMALLWSVSRAKQLRSLTFTNGDCGRPDYNDGELDLVLVNGCEPDYPSPHHCKLLPTPNTFVLFGFTLKRLAAHPPRHRARLQVGIVVDEFAVLPLISGGSASGLTSNVSFSATEFPWLDSQPTRVLSVDFDLRKATDIPAIPAPNDGETVKTIRVRLTGDDLSDQILCFEFKVEVRVRVCPCPTTEES